MFNIRINYLVFIYVLDYSAKTKFFSVKKYYKESVAKQLLISMYVVRSPICLLCFVFREV